MLSLQMSRREIPFFENHKFRQSFVDRLIHNVIGDSGTSMEILSNQSFVKSKV